MKARYTLRRGDGRLGRGRLAELEARHVFEAEPRRTFRWHRGQRHYPGRYWSSTMEAFVGYESRLELASLLLLDFDANVVRVASQPFEMIADRDGRDASHVPDYMVEHSDASFTVIDVKPLARLAYADIAEALRWAGDIIESRGWGYQIVSEPDSTLLANVRFLAGYRRMSQFVDADVRAATEAVGDARTLGEAMRCAETVLHDRAYARSVVLHLLWSHAINCELTSPLESDSILEGT